MKVLAQIKILILVFQHNGEEYFAIKFIIDYWGNIYLITISNNYLTIISPGFCGHGFYSRRGAVSECPVYTPCHNILEHFRGTKFLSYNHHSRSKYKSQ